MREFTRRVFEVVAGIPKGSLLTYAMTAERAGSPGAQRAVGNILHTNTNPSKAPCHRVVSSSGRTAKNYRFGGVAGQRAKLEKEGIIFKDERTVDSLSRFLSANGVTEQ